MIRASCLALLAVALTAMAAPRLEHEAGKGWNLTHLPPVLASQEVREHLETGLTTTFAFRVQDRDGPKEPLGGARVDIRFEVWDDIYEITQVEIDGSTRRHQEASFEALLHWWEELHLRVLRPRDGASSAGRSVWVILDVIPFSRAEQDDARRWLYKNLDQDRRSSAEEVAQSATDRPESLSRLFDVLVATSIRRDALISQRWSLTLPQDEPRPETPPR